MTPSHHGNPGLQQVPRHWRTHVAEPDKAYIHRLILLADIAALGGNHDRAAIDRRLDSHQLDYAFVPEQQKCGKRDIFIEATTR